jgi:hypothetical protein
MVLSLIHHNLHRKQFNSIQWWLIDSLIHSQDYILVLHLLLCLLNCFVATNYGKDHLKKDHVSTSLPLSPPCLWPMTIKMRCAIVLRLANDPSSSRCAMFSTLSMTHDRQDETCNCSLHCQWPMIMKKRSVIVLLFFRLVSDLSWTNFTHLVLLHRYKLVAKIACTFYGGKNSYFGQLSFHIHERLCLIFFFWRS